MPKRRLIVLLDAARPEAAQVLETLRPSLNEHAQIVAELEADGDPLPDDLGVEVALAIGGDGTLISQARRVLEHDLPLIGVNVGRLGFLAEFDAESLIAHAGIIFGDDPPIQKHMAIAASAVDAHGGQLARGFALNDAVVTAGTPFRMIELSLSIDGTPGPTLSGDGVIVATPTGSTAYNVSAGGPIVHPDIEALVITPLAAHSLAFRPIVLSASTSLEIHVVRANEGTELVLDGQEHIPLREGSHIRIRRADHKAVFITNSAASYWTILQNKLQWAAPPRYRRDARD